MWKSEIQKLMETLNTSWNGFAKRKAARTLAIIIRRELRNIDEALRTNESYHVNDYELDEIIWYSSSAIEALIKLLRTGWGKKTRRQAAESLVVILRFSCKAEKLAFIRKLYFEECYKIYKKATRSLVRLLHVSSDSYTIKLAVDTLQEIAPDDPRVTKALIKLLVTSRDKHTKRLAARSLEKIASDSKQTETLIINLLEKPAFRRPLSLFWTRLLLITFPIFPVYFWVIYTSGDKYTRMLTVDTLLKVAPDDPRVIEVLIKLLQTNQDKYTRKQADKFLYRIVNAGNPKATEALIRVLRFSRDKYIQKLAANTLQEIARNDWNAIAALVEVLRTSENKYVRKLAANTLQKIARGDRRETEALLELFRTSTNRYTRKLVADTLGAIGIRYITTEDRLAIEALIELLRISRNRYTQRLAAESLCQAISNNDRLAIDTLMKLLHTSWDHYTRNLAAEILAVIYYSYRQRQSSQISFLLTTVVAALNKALVRIGNFSSFIIQKTVIFIFDLAGKYKNIVDFCISKRDRNTAFVYIEKDKQKYVSRFARLANTKEKVTYFYKLKSLNPLPQTAIIEFFFTETQLITILVLPGEKSPNPSEDARLQLKNNPLETLPQDWISKLTAKTKKDDETEETLEYLPTTIDQISNLLNFKNLLKYIPPEINHLTIIPHKYLHLFPIHALWINDNQRLIDRFSIQYFPNLKVWNICQNRNRNRWEFIGIENPTQDKDLIFAKAEISTIGKCQLFKKTDIFSGQKATKSTILTTANNYHCLHFSGHAEYDYKNPLDSYLMLSDNPDENLTLNTILKNLKMPHTDLVTLSACCTGVVDVFQPADEYLGLATGFLLVGAKAVIGSLWKVNSIATAFLLDEFYRQLDQTENKALALQRAQNWLRRRSAEELRERAKTWDLSTLEEKEQLRLEMALDDFEGVPFQNPYYWAAFILTGC